MIRSITAWRLTCVALGSVVALARAQAPAPAAVPPAASMAAPAPAAAAMAAPPVAVATPVADTYFGTTVTDPYRWMEDLQSPQTQQWAKGQADHARAVLDAIPGRATLLKRIGELEASVPARITALHALPGGAVFYEKRGATDDQFKLYMRPSLGGAERLLVDPQALGQAAGAPVAINAFAPSPDGRFVAYTLSQGGSEEATLHTIEVATLKEAMAPIDRTHYADPNWLPDSSGFFYFRQRLLPKDAPETDKYKNQSAFFHRLKGGGADVEILQAGTDTHLPIGAAEFPLILPVKGTATTIALPINGVQPEMALYAAPTAKVLDPRVKWRKLFGRESGVTAFAVHGDDLYLLSHQNALRFKVLKTSLAHPDLALAHVVVAPSREVVVSIAAAKDALYVQARDGVVGKLYRVAYTPDAQPELVTLPAQGTVAIEDADVRLPGVVLSIGSWTHVPMYYLADAKSGRYAVTGLEPLGPFDAPDGLEAKEVLVKSWDNVEVPLSIVYPKGMKLDGGNPVHLYGYGAYGVTDDPVYVPRFLAWYELGGVRATCHVRGGGAYGEEWHLAGKQDTKPNTWKDLIACGEYLVKQGYTTPARLAIHGGSAGGILIGRAMTARPDLFAVAVPEVGVLNAVRSETSANGVPNIPEFGTVTDHKQFDALLEMDAYHHVVDGTKYPATLLITGINDPRVPPWESFKMAARLQAASTSGKPVLLRIDYAAGHGIGSTKSQRQEQYADIWSFMLWQFGDARFQPAK
jgi:prolyl oligopeptidase